MKLLGRDEAELTESITLRRAEEESLGSQQASDIEGGSDRDDESALESQDIVQSRIDEDCEHELNSVELI